MLNKQTVIGRIGRIEEVKSFENGNKVVNFSVASSHKWLDKEGNMQEETTWFQFNAWNKKADLINNYVNVGDLVYVEGKTVNEKKENEDGITTFYTKVILEDIKFLSQKKGENQESSEEESPF